MNIKEQVLKALQFYKNGDYDTKTFCDVLGVLYYYESGGYKFFHGEERKYLDELVEVTERFSPFEEDLESGVYFSEKQVKEKFDEVLGIMLSSENQFAQKIS